MDLNLGHPPAGLIAAAITILPLVLITLIVAVVALIAMCTRTAGARAHSLQVLAVLTDYARILRSRK